MTPVSFDGFKKRISAKMRLIIKNMCLQAHRLLEEDNMNQNKKQYEIEESILSSRSEGFLELLMNRGVIGKNEVSHDILQKAKINKKQSVYHNTLLMLQNYRNIEWMLECFPDQIAEELNTPLQSLDQLLKIVDNEVEFGNKKLEGRLKSMQRTKILMDRFNEALTVLRKKPGNGEKLYQLIYETYVNPASMDRDEILTKLTLSSRTYYRFRQQAIHIISIRLWSVPSQELDTWLEILSLLEVL